MSETIEYVKLVRINTEDSTTKGFQAKIKLPSAKLLPLTYDYINFYCGLGQFKCGISCGNKPESK